MAKVTASLSTRVDARGKSEVLLRFVGGRDHIYRLHSRIFISPSRWKDGAVVVPRLETQEQRELRKAKRDLEDLERHLLDTWQATDPELLNRAWMQDAVEKFHHPFHGRDEGFFPLFDEFTRTRDDSRSLERRYRVVLSSLERYQSIRGRLLSLATFSTRVLEDYRVFLEEEHRLARQERYRPIYEKMRQAPAQRGRNVIINYLKILRAFFNWLRVRGVQTLEPFLGFHIGTAVYGTPYYLTIEERERIYHTNLRRHPALAVQRDVFVFQCLVGCRVGDLVKLRKGDVAGGVLSYIPRKTINDRAAVVRVPLSRTALEIVKRYEDLPGPKLLPFISAQKYNDELKRIFRAAMVDRIVTVLDPLTRKEVKRPLYELASSHLARRTFIGNLYKQVQDPNLIGSLSGHREGSGAFARYRTIDDEMKSGLVDKLEVK